jgi:hypothetical protein
MSTASSHHPTLLCGLRSSVLRHFHARRILVPIHFRRTRWRKVLRRRIVIEVLRRGLGVRTARSLLVRLWVRVVRALLCVEGEVVLRDLAVAFAFRVGDEKLRCISQYDSLAE